MSLKSGAASPRASSATKVLLMALMERWLFLAAEQARRPHQQDDRHDDEDDSRRELGIEHSGQALDDAEREAGDDGAHDRTHPADDHHREYDDDEVRAHQRVDLDDRRREHPSEA